MYIWSIPALPGRGRHGPIPHSVHGPPPRGLWAVVGRRGVWSRPPTWWCVGSANPSRPRSAGTRKRGNAETRDCGNAGMRWRAACQTIRSSRIERIDSIGIDLFRVLSGGQEGSSARRPRAHTRVDTASGIHEGNRCCRGPCPTCPTSLSRTGCPGVEIGP